MPIPFIRSQATSERFLSDRTTSRIERIAVTGDTSTSGHECSLGVVDILESSWIPRLTWSRVQIQTMDALYFTSTACRPTPYGSKPARLDLRCLVHCLVLGDYPLWHGSAPSVVIFPLVSDGWLVDQVKCKLSQRLLMIAMAKSPHFKVLLVTWVWCRLSLNSGLPSHSVCWRRSKLSFSSSRRIPDSLSISESFKPI
jgi:hypothetical protein